MFEGENNVLSEWEVNRKQQIDELERIEQIENNKLEDQAKLQLEQFYQKRKEEQRKKIIETTNIETLSISNEPKGWNDVMEMVKPFSPKIKPSQMKLVKGMYFQMKD